MTATVSAGNGGAWHGRKANSLKLRVVNQRGLSVPTITQEDGVIIVTADTGYHDANDVATVANNTGFSSNWAITASSTNLTATTTDTAYATPGTDACKSAVTYNEPGYTTARTLTVGGVTTSTNTTSGGWATTWKTGETMTFDTAAVGSATIVLSATTRNASMVANAAATASVSLP